MRTDGGEADKQVLYPVINVTTFWAAEKRRAKWQQNGHLWKYTSVVKLYLYFSLIFSYREGLMACQSLFYVS